MRFYLCCFSRRVKQATCYTVTPAGPQICSRCEHAFNPEKLVRLALGSMLGSRATTWRSPANKSGRLQLLWMWVSIPKVVDLSWVLGVADSRNEQISTFVRVCLCCYCLVRSALGKEP